MRIGDVSARTGLSTATLRYYEREGLLPLVRRRSGKRCYDGDDVIRIRLIKAARLMGFGIAELRALGPRASDPLRERQALAQRLAQTQVDLARLAGQRELLIAALNCACSSPDQCAVLDLI